jgi:hypothetical protein
MIIPDYWDEHKEKRKLSTRKQATITRFRWSDLNQDDAKRHAKQRVEEAFQKLEDGQEVERREKRVSYNGSEGVPIREEVVQFHGDAVVSRNIYGALCINTPDVLFADIDFGENYQEEIGNFWAWVLMTGGLLQYLWFPNIIYDFSWNVLSFELQYFTATYLFETNPGIIVAILGAISWIVIYVMNANSVIDDEQFAQDATDFNMQYIEEFSTNHPDWNLRVYRTPAGLRIMVLHDVFQPNDPLVEEFFDSVNSDPQYVWMCKRQECFRARVSPKPWRVLSSDVEQKLDQGVWPVDESFMAERKKWVTQYEKASEEYASCRFERHVGSDTVHDKCEKLRIVHDEYCKAEETGLPLA